MAKDTKLQTQTPLVKWNKTLSSIYRETHLVLPDRVHEFLGDSLHVVVHVVALEVDRHVHRLHCTRPASPHRSSVARSRHVGHRSGLVKGYEIEGDDDFFFFFLCVWLLREWGKEPIRSLSLWPGFVFPCGCWFVLNFWVWFFHVSLMIFWVGGDFLGWRFRGLMIFLGWRFRGLLIFLGWRFVDFFEVCWFFWVGFFMLVWWFLHVGGFGGGWEFCMNLCMFIC